MINNFLDKIARENDLSAIDMEVLTDLCAVTRSAPGRTDLVKEGADSKHLRVVLDGWICRFRMLPDGRRSIVGIYLPGDICDLDRLATGRIWSGLSTITPCTVALLPRNRLCALFDQSPTIRTAIWALVAMEHAVIAEWQVCLGRRSAAERAAHLLCELWARLQAIGATEGGSCAFPLTQQDLSDAMGLSVVHTNRTMQMLHAKEVISIRRRRLMVRDWKALARLAAFDTAYLRLDGFA